MTFNDRDKIMDNIVYFTTMLARFNTTHGQQDLENDNLAQQQAHEYETWLTESLTYYQRLHFKSMLVVRRLRSSYMNYPRHADVFLPVGYPAIRSTYPPSLRLGGQASSKERGRGIQMNERYTSFRSTQLSLDPPVFPFLSPFQSPCNSGNHRHYYCVSSNLTLSSLMLPFLGRPGRGKDHEARNKEQRNAEALHPSKLSTCFP